MEVVTCDTAKEADVKALTDKAHKVRPSPSPRLLPPPTG